MRRHSSPPGRALAQLLLLTAPLWVVSLRYLLPELLGLVSAGPDVLLAALAVAAWNHRPAHAVLFATVAGALCDVSGGTPWGLVGARYGFLVAFFAALRSSLALEVPGARLTVVLLFALCERSLAALTYKLCLPAVALEPLLQRSWRIALLTLLVAPLAFAVSNALKRATGSPDS